MVDKNEPSKFQAVPKDFLFFNSKNKKIEINKFELSKAVNVNGQSGESGYAFIPRSYDKDNRKFEDKVVSDLNEWIKNREKNLKDELKNFYGELNYD